MRSGTSPSLPACRGSPAHLHPSLTGPSGFKSQGQEAASPGRACPFSDTLVHMATKPHSRKPIPCRPKEPPKSALGAGPGHAGQAYLDEALVLLQVGEGVPRERLRRRLVVGALQEDPGCAYCHDGCHHKQAEPVHCAGHPVPAVLLLGTGRGSRDSGGRRDLRPQTCAPSWGPVTGMASVYLWAWACGGEDMLPVLSKGPDPPPATGRAGHSICPGD